MRTVVFLGKRTAPGSPLSKWPGAHLAGTTHSNQKYAKRYGTVNDWHSWWDLHPFDQVPGYEGIKKRRASTYRWYQTLPGPTQHGYRPLYLAELDPTIPAGVLFPKRDVLEAFPKHGKFFTCQVDLMLAYFIMRGEHDRIVLHGHGTKFGHRPDQMKHMVDHCGVLVWMTIARERGIEVVIEPPSWYRGPRQPYGISPGNWGFHA